MPPDPRVAQALEQLKWPYKTDDDGDFQIVLELESQRTQLVLVRSRTYEHGTYELREMWSAAYDSPGPVDPEVARLLLRENLGQKLGSWAVLPQQDGKRNLVIYVARLPAGADADTLGAYISAVADVADDLEEQLGGKDEF